ARSMLAAAGVFALSMVMRSADMSLCASWRYGTHALWHLLNAATLFLLLRAVLDHEKCEQAGGDRPSGFPDRAGSSRIVGGSA
ncbi:MAG TPA: hypothetical protein PK264_08360, partial [Hyphomicrobiaceae bacterium]|nr:hypothetical protein [Hyphomicrobiaceae bacterium]